MQIVNRSRQQILATGAREARSLWARMLGLMFQADLPPGSALLLTPESSIHTFFMRFPIDVLYLARDGRVVRAVERMPPYRIGPLFTRGCHAILELPPGTISATGTTVGDQLEMHPRD